MEKGLLQYSWLENSMDKGAWWAVVYTVSKSDIAKHALMFYIVEREHVFLKNWTLDLKFLHYTNFLKLQSY